MNEGYTQEYEPSGDADREVELKKAGLWINVWEIPDIMKDQTAIQDLIAFRRFQRLGWPYGPWGMNPAPYVEMIDTLLAIEEKYHPKVVL